MPATETRFERYRFVAGAAEALTVCSFRRLRVGHQGCSLRSGRVATPFSCWSEVLSGLNRGAERLPEGTESEVESGQSVVVLRELDRRK